MHLLLSFWLFNFTTSSLSKVSVSPRACCAGHCSPPLPQGQATTYPRSSFRPFPRGHSDPPTLAPDLCRLAQLAKSSVVMRHGQFWARNPGGVGACSQPGGWAALRRVLNAESVGRLGNERKLGGSSGGGRMLSTARLSLPGPEYLGEERWGGEGRGGQRSAAQLPESPVPRKCCS